MLFDVGFYEELDIIIATKEGAILCPISNQFRIYEITTVLENPIAALHTVSKIMKAFAPLKIFLIAERLYPPLYM